MGPLPRRRLLLDGEMALLILLPTSTPTGGVPAQLALPREKRAWSRGRGGCESRRALGGEGWRLEVPGELCDEPASGGISLRELVLLRRGQLPPQLFDRTAQLNKDMIRQQVVARSDRQGIEGRLLPIGALDFSC